MKELNPFPLYSEMAISEILIFEKYAVFLRSDSVIQVQTRDDFDCTLKDGEKILECIKKVSEGKMYPLIAIYGDFNTFDHEVKELVAKHTLTKADALINHSFALRLLGNFYLKINKPVRPTQIFDDVETALVWLKTFNS